MKEALPGKFELLAKLKYHISPVVTIRVEKVAQARGALDFAKEELNRIQIAHDTIMDMLQQSHGMTMDEIDAAIEPRVLA